MTSKPAFDLASVTAVNADVVVATSITLKQCGKCKEFKPEAGFAPSIWNRTSRNTRCRACLKAYYADRNGTPDGSQRRAKHQREWRRRNVQRLWDIRAARGCEDCGETHPACLDFHHRDESEKSFPIAKAAVRMSAERLDAEVAKCVVLCSNCHRKRHYNEKSGQYGRRKEA